MAECGGISSDKYDANFFTTKALSALVVTFVMLHIAEFIIQFHHSLTHTDTEPGNT